MVLILRALDLETTQQRNLPGGAGGDGRKSKRGTNSIEFSVPVGPWGPRKIFFSSDELHPETRNS